MWSLQRRLANQAGAPNASSAANTTCWWTRWAWGWASRSPRASTPERADAQALLRETLPGQPWLWVDGGYSGPAFAQWVQWLRRELVVEVVKRSDDVQAFRVLPWRWVGERTCVLAHGAAAARARSRNHRDQRRGLDLYREDTNPTPPIGLIAQES